MERAARKDFHLPWTGKRHDLIDAAALAKRGYSAAQVAAQRRHLNPPEGARRYSSVLAGNRLGTCGRGFARSRLDSLQAWVPAQSKAGEWIEIDLGSVVTICK